MNTIKIDKAPIGWLTIEIDAYFFENSFDKWAKKSGMTRTDGHSQNEEIEINKGYGILTT